MNVLRYSKFIQIENGILFLKSNLIYLIKFNKIGNVRKNHVKITLKLLIIWAKYLFLIFALLLLVNLLEKIKL